MRLNVPSLMKALYGARLCIGAEPLSPAAKPISPLSPEIKTRMAVRVDHHPSFHGHPMLEFFDKLK